MPEHGTGKTFQHSLLSLANRLRQKPDPGALTRSTIVFAPHQDDETLGCGGTIILKRQAGAELKIVFMTDGRHSHSQFIPARDLAAIRKQEAIQAGSQLGLHENDLVFLGFIDGQLAAEKEHAVHRVSEILHRYQPEEVFIPSPADPQPDHIATNQVVLAALLQHDQSVLVYEYPVWFWRHWPWVRLWQGSLSTTKQIFKSSLKAWFGLQAIFGFNLAIRIEPVLSQKHSALDQYQSQIARRDGNPSWPILADVSKGDFLNCFFQPEEIFYTYRTPGSQLK